MCPLPHYQMLSAVTCRLRESSQSKITFDTKTAVNTFANRPITSVTAKPLTGPVPNMNRKRHDTIVVTWVSTIVHQAFPKPASSTAEYGDDSFATCREESRVTTQSPEPTACALHRADV